MKILPVGEATQNINKDDTIVLHHEDDIEVVTNFNIK